MSPMDGGAMPRPSEQAKEAFTKLVPGGPTVTLRPMFGNVAAFVNGNMFAGLFGEDLFVRLGEQERAELVEQGGRPFEPMAGRPMKEYVVVPRAWSTDSRAARVWLGRPLDGARALPPKEARRKR